MSDVTIHRCTVRLVRRGGWSWGPDPQRIIDAAARALPLLIARHLAGLFAGDVSGEIARPVRLRLALPFARLSAFARAAGDGDLGTASLDAAAVGEIDALLAQAVAGLPAQLQPLRAVAGAAQEDDGEPPASAAGKLERRWAGTVLRALMSWCGRGDLDALLRSFSPATLAAWERAVLGAPAEDPRGATPRPEELEAALTSALAAATAAFAPPATAEHAGDAQRDAHCLRLRLHLATALAMRLETPPWTKAVRAAIDGVVPPLPPPAPPRGRRPASTPAPVGSPSLVSRPAPPASRAARPAVEVECPALPFLLLGPLAQIGWLEAAAAGFDAEERAAELPTLAVALAFKVLAQPERGWRRSSAVLTGAAAFAGLDELPETLAGLADRPGGLLAPLDAVVARAVIRAHGKGEALVIARAPAGELLLCDLEGLFPIACGDADAVLDALTLDELVLVGRDAAEPRLLAGLDARGLRFVTDAPPVRDESWRLVDSIAPLAGSRSWTNAPPGDDQPLDTAARRLADVAEELGRSWRALTVERAVIASPASPALDRTTSLAAQAALACIAWTLWRRREMAHPALALARFADLDARVRFGEEAVEVRLPLGRRKQDLRAGRLLDDVPAVPWLGGRAVRFAG